MSADQAHFEQLYGRSEDPWGYRSRWYEWRKRALTLAALPSRRFSNAYEPACANGELSALLAERCERLLCSDGVALAVDVARLRLASAAHVEVIQAWLPRQWPPGRFDLVVLSEFGYYLSESDLDDLGDHARASLTAEGIVLACHWRRPIEGCSLSGDDVHRRLAARLQLPSVSAWIDADFRIDIWGVLPPLACREGLA
jgi:Nodulation protein S (NodS)